MPKKSPPREYDFASSLLGIVSKYIVVPANDTDTAISESLREVGELVHADRAYIFDYDFQHEMMSNTWEWCAEGIEPQIDQCQALPFDYSPDWVQTHLRNKPVHVPDARKIEVAKMRELVLEQDIQSLLTVPMMNEGELFGFVGFDMVRQAHFFDKHEIELLQVFSRILTNIRLRQEAELEREDLRNEKLRIENEYRQSQKMEAVGRLAGGVAHDFNNMLSVIIGSAEMGLLKVEKDSFLDRMLRDIHNAAERSSNLTRQLLTFSRKQIAQPELFDPGGVLINQQSMFRRLLGEDVQIDVTVPDQRGFVYIDRTQFDQILVNLLVNARDAIRSMGTIKVSLQDVHVSGSNGHKRNSISKGEYISITVADDGCGMDSDTLERIFEPFYTTKKTGTGLGLSTVYGIVRQHGGQIIASSAEGSGTTFTVYLPRHESRVQSSGGTMSLGSLKGIETVLVVEDEAGILSLAENILKNYGYRVLTAQSPVEAIELVSEYGGTIHLLLTDVVMPEMNGRELRDRLQADRPGLTTVFMSGYAADIMSQRGILGDDVEFLEKPFTIQSLMQKVRTVLNLHEKAPATTESAKV